jgi:hypothetical protein
MSHAAAMPASPVASRVQRPVTPRTSKGKRATRRATPAPAQARTGALSHAHETHEAVSGIEIEPPHPPRKETPLYRATHKRLVVTEDRPCYVCGVRRSDLRDPKRRADKTINPYGSKSVETHHWPVERSLADAVDPELVAQVFPSVRQFKTFIEWVDSEANMLVLCDQCHRLADHAIHRALWQDVIATKFAMRDAAGHRYAFAASVKDAAAVEVADEALVQEEAATPSVAVAAASAAS